MLWGMAEIPEVWAEWTGASWGMERVFLSSLGRVSEEPEAEPVWLRLRLTRQDSQGRLLDGPGL